MEEIPYLISALQINIYVHYTYQNADHLTGNFSKNKNPFLTQLYLHDLSFLSYDSSSIAIKQGHEWVK